MSRFSMHLASAVSFTAVSLSALVLTACLGSTENHAPPGNADFMVATATYPVEKTTVYLCDTLADSSVTCGSWVGVDRQEYSISVMLDSVEIPLSAKTFKGANDGDWWQDTYVGPCEVSLAGTLKARIGNTTPATYVSVPARVDTAIITSGGWRSNTEVLFRYLETADPQRYAALYNTVDYEDFLSLLEVLPDSFMITGRKPTRSQAIAFARDRLLNQCERYHGRDSVWVSTGVSPCGGQNPPCHYGVPLCSSDSLKAMRAEEYEWVFSPDHMRILVDTTELVGPNMSVSAAIDISCPTE